MSHNDDLILVIDDSKFSRWAIAKLLNAKGFNVIEAENGKEGLEKCRSQSIALVLLDLLMPEMNGLEFIKNLKLEGIDIPIVVVSADIQQTSEERCRSMGVTKFLKKPIKEPELVSIVAGYIPRISG